MEVTSNARQTVAVGGNVIFTNTAVKCPCGMVTIREDSGLLTLRGGARYLCTFGANIGLPSDGTPAEISLAMAIDGEEIPTSMMVQTPAAVSQFHNVGRSMYVSIPRGCCYTLSIQNTSNAPIQVEHANLIVERVN